MREFIKEIQYKNRNPRDVKALALLDDISTNPERVLPVGMGLFRGRIIDDVTKINKEKGYFGYGAKDSFIPPAKATKDLRANYRYISYLYCTNHPYTALVEVRPRLGARVSIATIRVNQELHLLDLSMLYSKPVTVDDDVLDYIPTQYIAEYAKNLGYDGIAFRSSLTPELNDQDTLMHQELDRYNVVIFTYEKCMPIKSNVVEVTTNYVECQQVDEDEELLNINTTLLDMWL